MVKKEVQVCGEVDTLLSVVVTVLTDVKAGKAAGDVVTDAVPALVSALSGLSQLGAEVADKKSLEMTVACKLAEIVGALTA